MVGDVHPQLGRAERGPLPLHHPEAGPQRLLGGRVPAGGEPQQRLGVPGAHPQLGLPAGARGGDVGELAAYGPEVAELQRDPGGDEPRVQLLRPPAHRGQPGRLPQRPPAQLRGEPLGPLLGAQRGVAGDRRPARPLLPPELLRRGARRLDRGVHLAGRDLRLREQQPRLGAQRAPPGGGELLDRPLGRLPRLDERPHRQQRLAPAQQQLAGAYAEFPVRRVGRVHGRQRDRDVTAAGRKQAEVEQGVRGQHPLPGRTEQLRGAVQVRLGGDHLAAVEEDQAAVVVDPCLGERVLGPAYDGQRLPVAVQGLLGPPDPPQHQPALHEQLAGVHAAQHRRRPVQLAQRQRRPPLLGEDEGERHPRAPGAGRVAGPGRVPHGLP